MKKAYSLFLALLLTGCGQSFNSNTNDSNFVAFNFCDNPGDTNLCEANEVIQTQCASCHTGYHSAWAAYNTSDDFVNAGLVTRGNSSASSIYTKLKGVGDGNMPPGAPAIPSTDIEKIRVWIESL